MMQAPRSRPDTWLAAVSTLILRIVVAAAVAYVLYRVGFIIVVVLMAVMLALTMAPLVDWLRRSPVLRPLPHHTRRSVATSVVFIGLALVLVETGFLIVRPLAREVSQFAANWPQYRTQLTQRLEWAQGRYNELPADVRKWIEEQEFRDIGAQTAEQVQHIAHRTVESGMLLVELILIPVLAFSFLTEGRPLKRELAAILPRSRLRDLLYVLRQTGTILQSYAIGQLILALIAGVVVWLMMTALGIRYALGLAVIAAITRVIPVVGPIIGGVPIVLISALQGLNEAVMVLAFFTIMHLLESKVVMPRIIGYRIKLHPAVVIIVLLIGAEFFGMWGMFLAAPVAAVVKAVIYYFFVRPNRRDIRRGPGATPKAPVVAKEADLERPAVAGIRTHSRAH